MNCIREENNFRGENGILRLRGLVFVFGVVGEDQLLVENEELVFEGEKDCVILKLQFRVLQGLES